MDNSIYTLLSLPDRDVLDYVSECMFQNGIACEHTEDYLYVKRDGPLLVQAHADTVLRQVPIITENKGIVRGNKGLGADDRAGIWIILKLLDTNASLLITNGEESGGTGMIAFLDKHTAFPGIRLAVALDRKGVGEYVTYNILPKKVHKYVRSFGFTETQGSFSDIEYFTSDTRIPSVNLSVGYHKEHTPEEYLALDEMALTLRRVRRMINAPIRELYKCAKGDGYHKRLRGKWYGSGLSWYYGDKYGQSIELAGGYGSYSQETQCDICSGNGALTHISIDDVLYSVCKDCEITYGNNGYHRNSYLNKLIE